MRAPGILTWIIRYSFMPVPELPGKSTFFGSSDEFIEKRRQGLQHFLEKVLQSVVLLSDSQLHLFLQSQLSVPEIEACVQGRSPMSVSDAILRYAMSNCGWAQEERRGSTHLAKGDQPKSCCFLPRSGRRSSLSPPPGEEKDSFESTGSGRAGSAAMAYGPSRPAACGIFPDRGTNPCPLHRQADSQPLRHQGSPGTVSLRAIPLLSLSDEGWGHKGVRC
ncbi:sorting nexin-11 isoform X3 [Tursiops truncatus]|uniref:sorting nexin-11 isoform X3 n=1 Tax=Tursiops truncatus TaxID=9739 RepID=UPI003CCF7356